MCVYLYVYLHYVYIYTITYTYKIIYIYIEPNPGHMHIYSVILGQLARKDFALIMLWLCKEGVWGPFCGFTNVCCSALLTANYAEINGCAYNAC